MLQFMQWKIMTLGVQGLTDGLRPVDVALFAALEACIQKALGLAVEPDMTCDGDESARSAAAAAVGEVVGIETDILKRRLARLKHHLRDTVTMFRQREADLHIALDNATLHRFKSEMQAVAGLMATLKTCIEKKTKVTHRISIEQSTLLQDVAICLDPSDVFVHAPPLPLKLNPVSFHLAFSSAASSPRSQHRQPAPAYSTPRPFSLRFLRLLRLEVRRCSLQHGRLHLPGNGPIYSCALI